jgi:diguanylate cyclase (GGDEF)-like protein/PAS domain S-box-containing protein
MTKLPNSSEPIPTGNGPRPSFADVSSDKVLMALPDAVILVDPLGTIRYVTEAASLLTGFSPDELRGQPVEVLIPVAQRTGHIPKRNRFARVLTPRPMGISLPIVLLRKDGSELPVDIGLGVITVGVERWTLAAIRDDSAKRAAENARAETEEHYRLAFENNMAPMIFTNLDDQIIAANDAFCQMIGYGRKEILGHGSSLFTHPEDTGITKETHRRMTSGEVEQVSYVKRYLHKDGRVIIVEVSKSPARNTAGQTLYYVISERDLTEERALAAQLSHEALHDPLTGLANRALFEDRLAWAHARAAREGGLGAVLLMDLDDFKGVNDSLGHLVGDQLLVAIARRLEQVTRSSDTLCRFGGDEFLYLAEGLNSPAEADQMATRLLDAIAEPITIEGARIEQHASVGIAVWDGLSRDPTESIQNADIAMYEAKRKRQGISHRVTFTPGLHEQAISRFSLIQELRHAHHSGELTMHYQPIVDLATNEVVGLEALMRWAHPERGWIPPDVFIPLAEQSDLILELGSFALREAVAAASSWEQTAAWIGRCFVTVNFSAHQFHDPDLLSMIEEVLRANNLAPDRLILEITESVTLRNVPETMNVIESLNNLGVGIALDDFGTGYTSLSYLGDLKPKIIKIDRSFVGQLHEHNDTLLETIISLGNKFNMTMLAEGIETEAQFEHLRRLGCELGQGYLFSPAVPVTEVIALLNHVSRKAKRATDTSDKETYYPGTRQ